MNIKNRNLCFLDLETTGFDPAKDSIIEISFVLKNPAGETIDTYDKVIIPDKSPLTPFISGLTGITDKEINEEGIELHTPEKEAIAAKIGDAIIVGHNIDFDIRFLEGNGIPVAQNNRIDTHELARILLIQESSYALEVLSKTYGFSHENAHRAMSDVEVSIDLYNFLLEKIESLPTDFVEKIRGFLEAHPDWIAGELFLNSQATGSHNPQRTKKKNPPKNWPHADTIDLNNVLEDLSEKPQFIHAGLANRTADLQKKSADFLETPSLIITDKFDYFEDYQLFPIPKILVDQDRLTAFGQKTELSNQEIFFYIQLQFRSFLGYRGKTHCDLFFQQESSWKQVCAQTTDADVFQTIKNERADEKVLILSPLAFWRLYDLDIFQDRTLIIDEAEIFAEKLLFSPINSHSLLPYLDSEDVQTATAAQFFVSSFCQEVIKPHLGHEIGPFPVRQLLEDHERFPKFSETLQQFENEDLNTVSQELRDPKEHLVRWYIYHSDSGNLTFESWHPDEWRARKEVLQKFQKIIFHRHTPSQSHAFFRIFLGIDEADYHTIPELHIHPEWIYPEDMVSAKSPDHNRYSAQKIFSTAQEHPDKTLAVLFSSLETLRKVFDETKSLDLKDEYSLVGERISGGRGKVAKLLEQKSPAIGFFQKMRGKFLEKENYQTVILQKFIFDAPHPLLEKLDHSFSNGITLWDVWTLPKATSNLSRRLADFPHAKKIICLDGRHNARWGKELLLSAFPKR